MIGADGRGTVAEPGEAREMVPRDMTRGGIAASAVLHITVLILVLLGLPNLFRKPPPQDMPIAVQLVTIAPETRATTPNPFRPRQEAKPEPPRAEPAPIPEPKPEPPAPSPAPPPAAAATPAPPPPPIPEAKPTPPAPPSAPKAEAKPLPPPPKPVEARAPAVPPPLPEHKPKPAPERRPVQQARVEAKPEPKPEARKRDPAAFSKLLQDLDRHERKDAPDAFDSLLKNLTKQKTARTEEQPPTPRQVASLSPPSSQPRAPLGSQLTASDFDLVRERLRPCFHPPFGAKENPDLVADVRVAMSPDGTVQQARIVDTGRYASDPVFRALADSGVRALRDPQCAPLPLPQDKYDQWKTFILGVSTKDMQ